MSGETDMKELNSEHSHKSIPCNECPAGNMHIRHITYFTWLGEELVTVPNFPAWVCDMCGKREYDQSAISWLSMLLNPEAGHPTRRVKRTRQPDPRKRNIPPLMLD
jgi:YgiT-type zinc finger domain-containing protein